jgi:hypothetical protein
VILFFTFRLKKKIKSMSRIPVHASATNAPEPNARLLLYIYNACEPSRKLLMDLRQLPEDVQLRIEVINIADVIDNGPYPPDLTHTPCLHVSNIRLPTTHNGRRAILLYFKLRAHDVNSALNADDAHGTGNIDSTFQRTLITDMSEEEGKQLRHDKSKLKNRREFEMLGEPSTHAGDMSSRFDNFIDDPTLADDPRMFRDPKNVDLDALRAQRGYA